MEVHAHSHTARKKWTHYFWEFLMLFLAVFCGFLAENLREHQIEYRRENQFMQSLLSDIKEDTLEINKSILKATKSMNYGDSVVIYLYNNPPGDILPEHFVNQFSWFALTRQSVAFNEVTAMQLKNAGNLRLIQNQEIIRKISTYWKEQENTRIVLDRCLIYRDRGRELEEKLFTSSDNLLIEVGIIKQNTKDIQVIQKDPVLWSQYANVIRHCSGTNSTLVEQLKKQLALANELILLLKKEYYLD